MKIITISMAVSLILFSSATAGHIVTDTDLGFTPNKQYGFGGWSLNNVNVKIVDVNDPHYNIGSFNETDGSYTPMTYGLSFESDISGIAGGVVGRLHGKDWPIGEPTGIKIIQNDSEVHNGKPENCIMTTSYLSGRYLNTAVPLPNTCSGPFQSHKRFKIDMMKSTYVADGAYGHPIDLVFNLEAEDSSTKRYQIFQKINNYTEKRLNGFKVEVLDANKLPNTALTLSLGYGEYVGTSGQSDIWDIEDMANMSHGLWGPVDDHFAQPGFFDNKRAYYPVSLSAGNTVLSYVGPMQGGNYQALFGNWLPSKWHPYGAFFDHDNNPATDAELVGFWGDPLHTGINGWHKGFEDNWASPSDEELTNWTSTGGNYMIQGIEDILNLGLNYIVNIGNNNMIGSTFTLRITPHFAPTAEQVPPSYIYDHPNPTHPGSERDDPSEGKGSVPAYDYLSLIVMLFGFLGIGVVMARRKLV